MSILIVHCELNRSDVKSFKSREHILTQEIRKGRRPDQISSNGSLFFVQTPETSSDYIKRLIESCGLNKIKDRLAVIDLSRGKAYIWGNFDETAKSKFPLLVEQFEAM